MTHDSPDPRASPAPLRTWHGVWPLAATLLFSTILVVFIIRNRADNSAVPPALGDAQAISERPPLMRKLPMPDSAMAAMDVPSLQHSVVSDKLNGTNVLRIRTHANGDELIVDAATGRLLAVRDQMGKTIPWLLSPVNVADQPPKSCS